ncbi:hypothetical protein Tco_0953071 [Tanacetum coccineum]|uniref:Transposase MuDR plant domain-containing protein n=1 Tax=Tanacetum coccineum TaxID=301880 RepID=A0ABQ5E1Q4_9ASTR
MTSCKVVVSLVFRSSIASTSSGRSSTTITSLQFQFLKLSPHEVEAADDWETGETTTIQEAIMSENNRGNEKRKRGDNLRNWNWNDVIIVDDLPDEVEAADDRKTSETTSSQEVIVFENNIVVTDLSVQEHHEDNMKLDTQPLANEPPEESLVVCAAEMIEKMTKARTSKASIYKEMSKKQKMKKTFKTRQTNLKKGKDITPSDVKYWIRKSKVVGKNFKLNFLVLYTSLIGNMMYVDGTVCNAFSVRQKRCPTTFWTCELLKERDFKEIKSGGLGYGEIEGPYVEEESDTVPKNIEITFDAGMLIFICCVHVK